MTHLALGHSSSSHVKNERVLRVLGWCSAADRIGAQEPLQYQITLITLEGAKTSKNTGAKRLSKLNRDTHTHLQQYHKKHLWNM